MASKKLQNRLASMISGAMFAIAWWLIIDIICQYPKSDEFNKLFLFTGIVGTLALILINAVSNSSLKGNVFDEHCLGQIAARTILFLAFVLAFGCIITSGWIFIGYYLRKKTNKIYPGVALLVHNVVIFLSTMVLKFGRRE